MTDAKFQTLEIAPIEELVIGNTSFYAEEEETADGTRESRFAFTKGGIAVEERTLTYGKETQRDYDSEPEREITEDYEYYFFAWEEIYGIFWNEGYVPDEIQQESDPEKEAQFCKLEISRRELERCQGEIMKADGLNGKNFQALTAAAIDYADKCTNFETWIA